MINFKESAHCVLRMSENQGSVFQDYPSTPEKKNVCLICPPDKCLNVSCACKHKE